MRKEVFNGKLVYHITEDEMLGNAKLIKAIKEYEKRGVDFYIKQNKDEDMIKEEYTLTINVPEKKKENKIGFFRGRKNKKSRFNSYKSLNYDYKYEEYKKTNKEPNYNNYKSNYNPNRRYGDYSR